MANKINILIACNSYSIEKGVITGLLKHKSKTYTLTTLPVVTDIHTETDSLKILEEYLSFGGYDNAVLFIDAAEIEKGIMFIAHCLQFSNKCRVCLCFEKYVSDFTKKVFCRKLGSIFKTKVVYFKSFLYKQQFLGLCRKKINTDYYKIKLPERFENIIEIMSSEIYKSGIMGINARILAIKLLMCDGYYLKNAEKVLGFDLDSTPLLSVVISRAKLIISPSQISHIYKCCSELLAEYIMGEIYSEAVLKFV